MTAKKNQAELESEALVDVFNIVTTFRDFYKGAKEKAKGMVRAKDGMCDDCRADFDVLDLEDKLERAFKYGDKPERKKTMNEELIKEDDSTKAQRYAIELHDLKNGVQEAIQEIIANCEYLTPVQRLEADSNNYLAYHKGITDGHESALKILRKHTGGAVL